MVYTIDVNESTSSTRLIYLVIPEYYLNKLQLLNSVNRKEHIIFTGFRTSKIMYCSCQCKIIINHILYLSLIHI